MGLRTALGVALALASGPALADPIRIATYSPDLSRDGPGLLLRDILSGKDEQVAAAVQVIAAADAGAGMRIWLDRTEAVPHIRALLAREGKGRGRVTLVPRLGDVQEVEITVPGGFQITPRLMQALKVLAGVERVEEV